MAQRITLEFAGKTFQLNADTPERESLMRLAAQEVNRQLEFYDHKFALTDSFDKLAFVALSTSMGKLKNYNMLSQLESEAEELSKTLEAYLQSVEEEKNR